MKKRLGWNVTCPRCANKLPALHFPTNSKQWVTGGWTCKNCGCEVDRNGREVAVDHPKPRRSASWTAPSKSTDEAESLEPSVQVHLDPTIDKVRVSEEEVNVPPGVCITVKRTRTIEHELRVDDTSSSQYSHEGSTKLFGLLDMKYEIEKEIEKQRGKTDKAGETMEYEVQLQGEKKHPSTYILIWSERWRNGVAEIRDSRGSVTKVPIRFKEAAELEVQKKQRGWVDPEDEKYYK